MATMSKAAAKITKINERDLHVSKPTSWLHSRFHFSFADWYGPGAKQNFGALRVLNDDLVKPQSGFGAHSHRDAEIFSYIVEGKLTHQDSMGHKEALPAGGVQYMSAGTGVVHSEMNEDPQQTCRFLQIWFTPDARGHTPQYGSLLTNPEQRHNQLLAVLHGSGETPAWAVSVPGEKIKLHQDATVVVSQFDAGFKHKFELGAGRQAYIVCIEGSLKVMGPEGEPVLLGMREAAEIVASKDASMPLEVSAGDQGAHFMLLEMRAA